VPPHREGLFNKLIVSRDLQEVREFAIMKSRRVLTDGTDTAKARR
jgi:hypothetical protein